MLLIFIPALNKIYNIKSLKMKYLLSLMFFTFYFSVVSQDINLKKSAPGFSDIQLEEAGELFFLDLNFDGSLILRPNGVQGLYTYIFDDDDLRFSISNINERAVMRVNAVTDAGAFFTNGPSGAWNTLTSWVTGTPDHGYIGVFDGAQNAKASMFVDANGDGVVTADIKNFRTQHPLDNKMEIWYASLEGPEAGAYDRGTTKLKDGSVYITLPDHFLHIADMNSMTVSLTPLNSDTYGIAVVKKDSNGFQVKELKDGTGNFDFDWTVQCKRKGFEDYKVLRQKRVLSKINESSDSGKIPIK